MKTRNLYIAIATIATILSLALLIGCGEKISDEVASKMSSFTDSRDGKTYRAVNIGGMTWMAENLNYDTEDGDGSWCYDNKPTNCEKYGRLYTWRLALMICPEGWHLPNDDEWATLEETVGGSSAAGKKLKSKRGWQKGGGGTNDFGFSALPGGSRRADGFVNIGHYGRWWSWKRVPSAIQAWRRGMNFDGDYVLRDPYSGEADAFSVRCVKDF